MRQMTNSEKAARLNETATELYRIAQALIARGQKKKAREALQSCLKTRQLAYDIDGKKRWFS